jgi:hypothetical protein
VLEGVARWAGALFVIGAIAFAVMFWGFQHDPLRAYHAYLTAYAFALTLVLGSMAFAMMAHAANTTWPVAVRRLAEAVAPAMPVLAVLFVPIVLGIRPLYPWARVNDFDPRVQHLLLHRAPFMNPGFFTVRAAAYLVIWSVWSMVLRNASLAMERGADPERQARRLRRLSYSGLVVFSLTGGISAFEWLMSLSPEFSSTMFGAMWLAACLFGGLACVVLLTGITQVSASPLPAPGPSHYSALGRLLFAFLIFLGYTMFFQFLLVWIGNRPSEAEWYLERSRGVYFASSMFLIFGHFLVPFFFLLSFSLKRRIRPLTWIAVWCLLSQYIHVHWLVTPASREPGASWFDLIALIAVLAIPTSVCLWVQSGKALAPVLDPRYPDTFEYQSR